MKGDISIGPRSGEDDIPLFNYYRPIGARNQTYPARCRAVSAASRPQFAQAMVPRVSQSPVRAHIVRTRRALSTYLGSPRLRDQSRAAEERWAASHPANVRQRKDEDARRRYASFAIGRPSRNIARPFRFRSAVGSCWRIQGDHARHAPFRHFENASTFDSHPTTAGGMNRAAKHSSQPIESPRSRPRRIGDGLAVSYKESVRVVRANLVFCPTSRCQFRPPRRRIPSSDVPTRNYKWPSDSIQVCPLELIRACTALAIRSRHLVRVSSDVSPFGCTVNKAQQQPSRRLLTVEVRPPDSGRGIDADTISHGALIGSGFTTVLLDRSTSTFQPIPDLLDDPI